MPEFAAYEPDRPSAERAVPTIAPLRPSDVAECAALTAHRLDWVRGRAEVVYYFANARNGATIDLHRRLGFEEVTRDFAIPGVAFEGGVGVLFRARPDARPAH